MKTMTMYSMSLGILLAIACALMTGCGTAQSPHRQVEDSVITTQLKTKLASDVSPSSLTNIDVNTTNGVVTLTGQVESEDIKNRAEEVARAVQGVVSVDNNLQVERAARIEHEQTASTRNPHHQIEDSVITAQVKTKLATDLHLSSLTSIAVDTTNGVVTLAGKVETEDAKNRAEEITRAVQGVARVYNNLQVERAGRIEHEPARTGQSNG